MQQIADWLEKLGISEYAQRFAENDIDASVLPHLTDQILKELGVSLGHRLKILAAIKELGGPTPAAPGLTVVTAEPVRGQIRGRLEKAKGREDRAPERARPVECGQPHGRSAPKRTSSRFGNYGSTLGGTMGKDASRRSFSRSTNATSSSNLARGEIRRPSLPPGIARGQGAPENASTVTAPMRACA
jgi:hypothetical protein